MRGARVTTLPLNRRGLGEECQGTRSRESASVTSHVGLKTVVMKMLCKRPGGDERVGW